MFFSLPNKSHKRLQSARRRPCDPLAKKKGYAAEYDDFSDVAAFVVLTILIVRLQGIGLRKRIKRFRLKFGRTGIKPREPRRCLWTRGLLERLDGVYIKCSMYACSYTLS